MSRCFPYPSPDFNGNCTRDVAVKPVIGSIKLQREEKKAQTERREEKKVKKERRKEKKREKKEKEKTRRNGEIEHQKKGHKKRRKDDLSQENKKVGNHQNSRKNETDHFEKSTLTEEHGHPIGSENICYSSDGSLNSNKRQKYSSPPNGKHNSGNIFRIRLPLQWHKDLEVLPSKGQPCSALGRTDVFVQEMCDLSPKPGRREGEHLCFASGITGQGLDHKLGRKNPCPSSAAHEIFGQKPEIAPASISSGSDSSLLEPRFKDLLDYSVPPLMQSQFPASDNQDWLLETKQNHNLAAERCETNHDGGSYGNSAQWSRVCYLPEVDIYALPFTVPF